METFVKNLAAREGWRDETTAGVLMRVLDAIIGMGIDRDDIEALVLREGGLDGSLDDDGPEDGDVVRMRNEDVTIVVDEVPDEQPERDNGIWIIIDENGDEHQIERDSVDDPWYVVVPAI